MAETIPTYPSEEYLREEYINKGLSLSDIAKTLGCTRQNVFYMLKRYGIERRSKSTARRLAIKAGKISVPITELDGTNNRKIHSSHSLNENFFDEWSPAMAYVLGFIYTDGYLYYDIKRKTYRISIAQAQPEILYKLSKLMDLNSPLSKSENGISKNGEKLYIYNLEFCSEHIFKRFESIGLKQKKSLTMHFPEMPESVRRHFIRGCWDGDGSFFIQKNHVVASYISGSKKFVDGIVKELTNKKITIPKFRFKTGKDGRLTPTKFLIHKYPGKKAWTIKIHNRNSNPKDNPLFRFFVYLYGDVRPEQYLERKFFTGRSYFSKVYPELISAQDSVVKVPHDFWAE